MTHPAFQHFATFLLAFGALFSIVNPFSSAFIFFGATLGMSDKVRDQLARWVAIYAFCIVALSLYVGAYVLLFFGISIPVLRVAGGIIVAIAGLHMLNAPDATEQRRSETPSHTPLMDVPPSRLAFYPLTMPLTAGPGTISVAISLGAGRPNTVAGAIVFFAETLAAVALIALLVYFFYRYSARLAGWIGPTGTTIIVRLSAFLLFCIGIQVFWNGAAELLGTLSLGHPGSG